MTQVQIIPGDFTITDPNVPRYPLRKTLTSDDFTGTGELAGTLTNAALGGEPALWGGATPSGWERLNGALTTTPDLGGAGNLTLPGLVDGAEVEFKVSQLAAETAWIYVSLRASPTDRVYVGLRGSGRMTVQQDVGGSGSTLASFEGAFTTGDRIKLGVSGGVASVWVNGDPLPPQTFTAPTPSYLAFSYYPANGVGALDDLVVTVPAN